MGEPVDLFSSEIRSHPRISNNNRALTVIRQKEYLYYEKEFQLLMEKTRENRLINQPNSQNLSKKFRKKRTYLKEN